MVIWIHVDDTLKPWGSMAVFDKLYTHNIDSWHQKLTILANIESIMILRRL